MLPEEFISKHPLGLTKAEAQLCQKAMEIMSQSKDVHHGASHVYRLLDFLDEFMVSKDFRLLQEKVDLKVIYISFLWHDCWRSQKDPEHTFALIWGELMENVLAPALFSKFAKQYGIDKHLAAKIKYCIKKHARYIIIPLKGAEAKIVKALDVLDQFSSQRIAILQRKYLLDRPIRPYYPHLAKLALKIFLETDVKGIHYFSWVEKKVKLRKAKLIPELWEGIKEYEVLLSFRLPANKLEYEKQFAFMKQKYLKD